MLGNHECTQVNGPESLPICDVNAHALCRLVSGVWLQNKPPTRAPTRLFELEVYPADLMRFDGVAEITPIDPDRAGGSVLDREKIEDLLGKPSL